MTLEEGPVWNLKQLVYLTYLLASISFAMVRWKWEFIKNKWRLGSKPAFRREIAYHRVLGCTSQLACLLWTALPTCLANNNWDNLTHFQPSPSDENSFLIHLSINNNVASAESETFPVRKPNSRIWDNFVTLPKVCVRVTEWVSLAADTKLRVQN